jgi:hypothetical protein
MRVSKVTNNMAAAHARPLVIESQGPKRQLISFLIFIRHNFFSDRAQPNSFFFPPKQSSLSFSLSELVFVALINPAAASTPRFS